MSLSHIGPEGKARMVDVGAKQETARVAVAEGVVRASDELLDAIDANTVAKGNVLETARLAGIQAAKRAHELIPLCHPLPIDHIEVEAVIERPVVRLKATVSATARTGVEMEALTAVTVAALTVYDMGKAIDKSMVIEGVRLLSKTGGAGGDYEAAE
ncbi:MAG: cyclic pyranopterin monophosphate synthase MoaC [Acidimicrobiia bacterium]|nr:cyclic pyranopterin monophosphate synthase MoaC [Acidimicrobiia bacterium]